MLIKVTQEHINQASELVKVECKPSSKYCPTALAIKDALGSNNVYVGFFTAVIGDKHIRLPDEVNIFIWDFVLGQKVQPFEFNLPYEGISNDN